MATLYNSVTVEGQGKTMVYQYTIVDLMIKCSIPFEIVIQKESKEFLQEECGCEQKQNVFIDFVAVDKIPERDQKGHWEVFRYYSLEAAHEIVWYHGTKTESAYACVIRERDDIGHMTCLFEASQKSRITYTRDILGLLNLETILSYYQSFILHSSFIRWNGCGILFTAPSGTGKSTQAYLWEKYEGADIINGDRAGLREFPEGWKAYGLPYAGSSGIYCNESAPVGAIMVLRQAKENRIYPLRPVEAMQYLYSEVTIHHWDRGFAERVLNLLTALVTSVPIYLLECLPNREAVELVKHTIFKDERKGG